MPPLSVRPVATPAASLDIDLGSAAMPGRAAEDDDLIGYEAALPFLRHDTAFEPDAART